MLDKFINSYCKLLEYAMALFLALMVAMVFGNVVLRYGFNSGISISEELSRWLFVWVTFMGSVVALNERGHLGTDMMVSRLGLTGKKLCMGLSLVLMLALCGVLFKGAWEQVIAGLQSFSTVMHFPLALMAAAALVMALLMLIALIIEIIRDPAGMATDKSADAAHGVE